LAAAKACTRQFGHPPNGVQGSLLFGVLIVEILRFFSPWNSPLSQQRQTFRFKFDHASFWIHDDFVNSKA
jgi:hypothetical protein